MIYVKVLLQGQAALELTSQYDKLRLNSSIIEDSMMNLVLGSPLVGVGQNLSFGISCTWLWHSNVTSDRLFYIERTRFYDLFI